MSHDKLCPVKGETWCVWPGDKCQVCLVIARARDEGYAAALRDAVEAVEELPYEAIELVSEIDDWIQTLDAIAAIEALGGER